MSLKTTPKIVLGLPCVRCYRAAFYLKERPLAGEPLFSSYAFCKNPAREPMNGTSIRCQWCEFPVMKELLPRDVTIFDYDTGEKV